MKNQKLADEWLEKYRVTYAKYDRLHQAVRSLTDKECNSSRGLKMSEDMFAAKRENEKAYCFWSFYDGFIEPHPCPYIEEVRNAFYGR